MFKSNRKGLLSVKSRRQALKLCLDAVVVVVIEIFNELLLEVIHRLELLQIQKFTFKQAKEVFYYSIVWAVIFPVRLCQMPFLRSIRRYCLCWYCQPGSE